MGHQHLFQQIDFYAENATSGDFIFPQQYIVGHDGLRIDHDGLGASPCGYDGFDIGGTANNAVVWSLDTHGYVVWNRSATTIATPAGWVATPHDGMAAKQLCHLFRPACPTVASPNCAS